MAKTVTEEKILQASYPDPPQLILKVDGKKFELDDELVDYLENDIVGIT